MINHLRTLLLNQDSSRSPGPTFPGEQIVHPGFRARALPGPLLATHRLVFGSGPDRATLNTRLQEVLSCVHAAGYGEYVTAMDPRITYLPFNTSLMERYLLGASARKLTSSDQNLYFLGDRSTTESVNRIYFSWRLDVIDASNVRITEYADAASVVQTTTVGYTTSSGLSSPIDLPGSLMQARFDVGVGASWLIDVLAKPSRSFAQAVSDWDGALTESMQRALWPEGSAEPYLTFRNLWQLSDQEPARVAGLILALGHRLDELSR